MITTGRTLAGRYNLQHQLATGGTARVYVATDEVLGRQVAVKLLDSELAESSDPAGRERFLREGRTAAQFVHPNAVMVLDAGEDDGELFLVLELVEGPTLAQHLRAQGALPVDECVRIAGQLLGVLAAAHEQGVVHRDVKPANVLLTPTGDVKLADFGIAKRFDDLEDSVTSTGLVVGTPRYLAPEQLTGGHVSAASDVYAVGIVLFEMLAGRPPFRGANLSEAVAQQQAGPPPDVRSVRPDVPAALAAVISAALAPDPTRRPNGAAAMAQMLQDLDATATPLVEEQEPAQDAAVTQVTPRTEVMAAMPAAPLPPPSPAARRSSQQLYRRRRHGWMALPVVVAVLSAIGLVVLVAATRDGTPDPLEVVPPTEQQVAPDEPAPPADGAVPPDEVVPGFPWTDDLEVFLAQLEDDPQRVGPAGEEIARDLRLTLEQNGRPHQARAASALQEKVVDLAKTEQLDPGIMMVLHGLLEPLAQSPGRS